MALSVLQYAEAQYPSGSGGSEYLLSSYTTIGNAVVLFIATGTADTVSSVVSPIGTFTKLNGLSTNANDIEAWACFATGAGSQITITTSDAGVWFGCMFEITGSPSSIVSGGTATSASTTNSITIAPSETGDLILAATTCSGSSPITSAPSSPWSDLNATSGWIWAQNEGQDAAWQIAPSTASLTATWVNSYGGSNIVGVIVKAPPTVLQPTRPQTPMSQAVSRAANWFKRESGLYAPEQGLVVPRAA